jgi:arylsulfatase A-like enzyme
MPLSRRHFMKVAGASAAATALSQRSLAILQKREERPNIVFCIADDWSFGHASAYGDGAVKTPTFDRVASQGMLFTHSFCIAPSCTPSRAGILTGQPPHRLEEGGNLWGFLPAKFDTYTDLLEKAGYSVGLTGKGWGPGRVVDRRRNPAGPNFKSFDEFLAKSPEGKPFCYWFGSGDPHRPYQRQLSEKSGIDSKAVTVPPIFPDTPEVRQDLVDYYAEVQRFDSQVGEVLDRLERTGQAENTIVVITSDNGMPFPHSKANLYDSGTRMPLAMRWPAAIRGGRTTDAFVSHLDFFPTFLEAAGLDVPRVHGRSLTPLLTGNTDRHREHVFVERERHASCRAGNVGYPCRGIRSREHLYIRNFKSDRWPAGDPNSAGVQGTFGDIDSGPTKSQILTRREEEAMAPLFALACGKRPAEELYDVATDPWQMKNLADDPKHSAAKEKLAAKLDQWMRDTADPRASGGGDEFDRYPYFGGEGPARRVPNRGGTGG